MRSSIPEHCFCRQDRNLDLWANVEVPGLRGSIAQRAGLGTTGLWLPRSFPPVAGAATMVGNSQDFNFFTGDSIDNRVGEVPHDQTALSIEPECAQ